MKKHAIALLLFCLAACSTTTPDYDGKFGNAVREAKLKMTINPDAGKNPDQAAGMDGKAANDAIIRYQNTFKLPPPTANITNIGGSLSSGGGGM
jgi:hypothetical protein